VESGRCLPDFLQKERSAMGGTTSIISVAAVLWRMRLRLCHLSQASARWLTCMAVDLVIYCKMIFILKYVQKKQ
jgi:hypothetical protein